MSNESFKVKNGLTLTPVDLTTLTSPQAGDLACDINDSNKIKRYDSTTSTWVVAGGGLSAWTTATPYAVGDVVTYSNQAFICLTAHTAATSMEADIASGYWQLLNLPQQSRNYMLIGNNFEDNDAGGWQLFTIAGYVAGSNPSVAPTLGSAASLTVGTTATSPLSGKYSLVIGNTASTNITAGQGIISQVFSIDRVDQAKVLATQFAYEVANGAANMVFGTTSTNTFGVFIYDVTNSAWIQPAGVYSLNQKSGVGKTPSCNWQTPLNMTQFKVAVLCMNTTTATTPAANALQMKFDDFFTGPSNYTYGTPVTDWTWVTPTAGASGTIRGTTTAPTFGTIVVNKLGMRRVGGNMELIWNYKQSTAGTAGTGVYLLDISQFGVQIDTTNLPANSATAAFTDYQSTVGTFYYTDSGGSGIGNISVYSATQLKCVMQFASSSLTSSTDSWRATYGGFSSASVCIAMHISVPILGWSSSVQMSDNAAQSVILASATGTPANVTAGNPIIYPTLIKDTTGSYNTSTGRFTVPTPGFYQVGISGAATVATTVPINIYKNAVQNVSLCFPTTSTGNFAGFNVVECVAGDILDARPVGSSITSFSATTNYNSISFTKISGPNSIGATETVAASYWLSANFAASTTVPINFDSKEFDYWGSVTTSATAWKFTAPIAGLYSIQGSLGAAGVIVNFLIYKNGSSYKNIGGGPVAQNGNATSTIRLLAGEYIDIRPSNSTTITGGSLSANGVSNISITKVGNY